MTKEEILNMPAGSEINALFAELVMEWKKEKYQGVWGESFYWIDSQNSMKHIGDCFCPSTNISHAFEGEGKLKTAADTWRYVNFLEEIIEFDAGFQVIYPSFDMIHATAHQRTRALILWAMEKEATNDKT